MAGSDADIEDLISLQEQMEFENFQEPPNSPPVTQANVQPQANQDLVSSIFTLQPPTTPILDATKSLLADPAVDISNQVLGECVRELDARWVRYQRTNSKWAFVCIYRLFGLEPDNAEVDLKAVATMERSTRDTCLQLYHRLKTQGVIDTDDPTDTTGNQLAQVVQLIGQCASMITANHHRSAATVTNFNASNIMRGWKMQVGTQLAGSEEDVAALTAGQRLILNVLEKAFKKNLRKHHGSMFEQVLTRGDGHEYRTHAWKEYCSIKDFVYMCANKHEEWDTWCDLTSAMKNPDFVTDYITNATDDFELRSLDADRHIFSFNNGVYDAYNDMMYAYHDGIPDHFVASKYFDTSMPVTCPHGTGFRDVQTPVLDGILIHQKFNLETCDCCDGPHVPAKYRGDPEAPGFNVIDWIYVFMGRMIYAIGEFDTWQTLMFMKGKAGTGKSTLGKVISYLYNPVDVAVLSNNIETKFGLSGIYEALIYLCYEVKKDFRLDQGEMQSMISGEPISIAIKNQDPKSITWMSHGFFMGNEIPRWVDNSGSISRRIVLALFDTFVTDGDPGLFEKLQAEMGNIIVKINRAYRECSAAYGCSDIWSVIHPYFDRMSETQVEASTSYAKAYLVYLKYEDNGRTYTFTPGGRVSLNRFKNKMELWVLENFGVKTVNFMKEKENLTSGRSKLRIDDNDIVGLSEADQEAEAL